MPVTDKLTANMNAEPDPGSWTARGGLDSLRRELSVVIEGEIIPRLLLAHPGRSARSSQRHGTHDHTPPVISEDLVDEFSRLVMEHDASTACTFADGLSRSGFDLETIFVQLLAPTARRLGQLWEEDQADFTEVTVGLWRLQHVLRELGMAFEAQGIMSGGIQKRILIAPIPGEQHTFGMMMVAEFFRREGWEVLCDPTLGMVDLARLVSSERLDVLALSVCCETLLENVTRVISGLRAASCNPEMRILIGGRIFAEQPALAREVGADATAADAASAVKCAEQFLCRDGRFMSRGCGTSS